MYHPDKYKGEEAKAYADWMFKKIDSTYNVFSNPKEIECYELFGISMTLTRRIAKPMYGYNEHSEWCEYLRENICSYLIIVEVWCMITSLIFLYNLLRIQLSTSMTVNGMEYPIYTPYAPLSVSYLKDAIYSLITTSRITSMSIPIQKYIKDGIYALPSKLMQKARFIKSFSGLSYNTVNTQLAMAR